ncbi:hypothetical protein EXN66_Car018527 [Channa argus]|uniref:Uncharacterized protein n=1 Tax=Channa argus TaxID=215402 RepID=A0A6G1QKC9_CHAAH|nr:hypothetical protein EXN66_Car018527 [Channa argus]
MINDGMINIMNLRPSSFLQQAAVYSPLQKHHLTSGAMCWHIHQHNSILHQPSFFTYLCCFVSPEDTLPLHRKQTAFHT